MLALTMCSGLISAMGTQTLASSKPTFTGPVGSLRRPLMPALDPRLHVFKRAPSQIDPLYADSRRRHIDPLLSPARVVQSLFGPFAIKERLAEDLAAATPLPVHRFDPCVIRPAVVVDKYQTIAFDGNRYSAPRPFALQMVTVKAWFPRAVSTCSM